MPKTKKKLSASEALYGFCGWLTTREQVTKMSSSDDSGHVAALIHIFMKANNIDNPRPGWEDNLVRPNIVETIEVPEDQKHKKSNLKLT